jgi:hypothetical protein
MMISVIAGGAGVYAYSQSVLRIPLDGAAGTTGNDLFDNILASAMAATVPEPSRIARLGLLLDSLACVDAGFASRGVHDPA